MASKPMLDDVELQQVQKVEGEEEEVFEQHSVPALEGDFLQDLGRRAATVTLTGVLTGEQAGDGLKALREKFQAAAPVSFVEDIATATKVGKVLIEEMGVRDLAGKPERFEYAFTLREFIPPPKPKEEPPPPPQVKPDVTTGTLIVEVIVEGQPGFDFNKVTVSVDGTLAKTLTNRIGNLWTEEKMPPGKYTAKAVVTDPPPMSGTAPAEIRLGATTKVTITLTPGVVIAHRFIIHFRFDKAFLEPCLREVLKLAMAFAASDQHKTEKLLVTGNTDLVGSPSDPLAADAYNQSLSERRARSVFAFLTFGRDADASVAEWTELRKSQKPGVTKTVADNWGTRQYQYMLQDLGFYPGRVDGREGKLTQAAVRAFRKKKGLPPGTTVDDPVWAALIRDYMAQDNFNLGDDRLLPNCGAEKLKWVGCASQDPVKSVTSPWRPNRRVELLLANAAKLPCDVPKPDTFDLPAPGAIGSGWCVGPAGEDRKRACFVVPNLPLGGKAKKDEWQREPAETGSITVQVTILKEVKKADGSVELQPAAGQKFTLIAPDGEVLQLEAGRLDPVPAVTGADGTKNFDNKPLGVYIIEVGASTDPPVLVRLEPAGAEPVRGPSVCKHLTDKDNHLTVVILLDPPLIELVLPVVAHLMTALRPDDREQRMSDAASTLPQATVLDDKASQALFDGANNIWRQARIRFGPVDFVHEFYNHPITIAGEVDHDEFTFVLKNSAYPDVVNVYFFGDLAGIDDIGFGISIEKSAEIGTGGAALSDRAAGAGLTTDVKVEALAHELGHFLNLEHVTANGRLMLPGTLDGKNTRLDEKAPEHEVTTSRQSQGAALDFRPVTMKVTGATRFGGPLSHKFIVIQKAGGVVTVDAALGDTAGTITMDGGAPGATGQQRTVATNAAGPPVVVKATYAPDGGGDSVDTHVEIRVVTFDLKVDGAQSLGGPGSTRFVALSDPAAVVRITAVLSPAPLCVPADLVIWTNGDATVDPLHRTVSRSKVASIKIDAKVADTTRSVTITTIQFDVAATATAAAPAATFVRFGLWDKAYDAAENIKPDNSDTDNFISSDARKLHVRVFDPSAAGPVQVNWKTLKADNTDDDAPIAQAVALTETAPGSKIFISGPLILATDDVDKNVNVRRVRRAKLDGSIRFEYSPGAGLTLPLTLPLFNRKADERRRVNARVIRYSNAADPTFVVATDAYITAQFSHANLRWNQIGSQIDAGATSGRPIPAGALVGGKFPASGANSVPEVAVLADLLPITPDKTLTVVFVDLSDANAYSTVSLRNPVPVAGGGSATLDDRFFIFINSHLDLNDETLAHELHHVLFNRFDTDTQRRFFTLNTQSPNALIVGTGIALPDARIYRRIQNRFSPDPNNDPTNDNIINWARRVRIARQPAVGGLTPATATTGNLFLTNF